MKHSINVMTDRIAFFFIFFRRLLLLSLELKNKGGIKDYGNAFFLENDYRSVFRLSILRFAGFVNKDLARSRPDV